MISFIVQLRVTVAGPASLILLWSWPAYAQDFTCHNGNELQRVHVVIENAESELPCEVILWLPPKEPRPIWRNELERGFCAEKLRALVLQLTNDQWVCRPTDIAHAKPRP